MTSTFLVVNGVNDKAELGGISDTADSTMQTLYENSAVSLAPLTSGGWCQ
jgi:hypothetical protein